MQWSTAIKTRSHTGGWSHQTRVLDDQTEPTTGLTSCNSTLHVMVLFVKEVRAELCCVVSSCEVV